ncbi:MAG: hypothetical protein ABI340_10955 [Nitrososphaera sp.]
MIITFRFKILFLVVAVALLIGLATSHPVMGINMINNMLVVIDKVDVQQSMVTITGHASGLNSNTVIVKITNPNGNLISIQQIPIDNSGQYKTKLTTTGILWHTFGTYTVTVQYGSNSTTGTFNPSEGIPKIFLEYPYHLERFGLIFVQDSFNSGKNIIVHVNSTSDPTGINVQLNATLPLGYHWGFVNFTTGNSDPNFQEQIKNTNFKIWIPHLQAHDKDAIMVTWGKISNKSSIGYSTPHEMTADDLKKLNSQQIRGLFNETSGISDKNFITAQARTDILEHLSNAEQAASLGHDYDTYTNLAYVRNNIVKDLETPSDQSAIYSKTSDLISGFGFTLPKSPLSVVIPAWIKNNAGWWHDGTIDDNTFVQGIQYMIQNGIIQVPTVEKSSSGSNVIPAWIKNNAGWWHDGTIDDNTFVQGIQYMIQNGIIVLNQPSGNLIMNQ